MTERNTTRYRFNFLCPFGQEEEARALLAEVSGVRLVPVSKNQIASQTIFTASESETREGVLLRGVATSHGTFLRIIYQLSDAKIAAYSRETKIFSTESNPEQNKLRHESETDITFENGGLTVEHHWGRNPTAQKEMSKREIWRQTLHFRTLLGTGIYIGLQKLYHSTDRRQFFRIINSLEAKRTHQDITLSEQITIDWTLVKLYEIISGEKR